MTANARRDAPHAARLVLVPVSLTGVLLLGLARPASADGLPVLGPVPGVDGVHLATGHGPSGLQLGPYSGRTVARVALGEGDASDLERFAVGRFESATA